MFKTLRIILSCRFRSHFLSSITSSSSEKITATTSTHFMVDYLIHSLGFHENEALVVSSKVTHLKSTSNSDALVNVLKDYGLDNLQIRTLISAAPNVLTIKANKTLEPKLRVFKELGLSGSDLVKLIKKNPFIFRIGLHTQIIPTIDYLRKLLGCEKKVIDIVNRSNWLVLTDNTIRRISANMLLLQKYGLSTEKILSFFVNNPHILKQAPELIEAKLHYVEGKLGISQDSPIFIHGLIAILYCSDLEIEKNMQVFGRFGWSDLEIATLLRSQPYCLNKSEDYISDKLNFFMKELGYKPSYLSSCTSFWTLSLEKRVKPRNEVLKILKERGLVTEKPSLVTVVKYTESKFLGFLQSFESEIPGLYESYMKSARKSKAE